MKTDLEGAFEKFCKYENELGPKESAYKALDALTKTVLARNWGTEGTVKEKENHALTSVEYIQHIGNLDTARKEFIKARSQRDIWYNAHLVQKQLEKNSSKII